VLAIGYLGGLICAALALRFVGEQHWTTTALLYLPRAGFALPLPFVAAALALFGPRRLLWLTPVAAAVVLFPLMGLVVRVPRGVAEAGAGPAAAMRVLSFNVGAVGDPGQLTALVRGADPDLLVLQEYDPSLEPALAKAVPGFHRHTAGQFAIASRYPIEDVYLPPRLDVPGSVARSSRFVRYRIGGPLGPLTLLNVHPVSPREGLEQARGVGVLHDLLGGRIARREGIRTLEASATLRRLQAEEIVAEAQRSRHPVVIAGDTNLPGLSWILARTLSRFVDGFSAAGSGFGYTFPARRAWMRIDRILADERVAFLGFEVIPGTTSDHRAVLAVLARR
jgi:vancomycin resistance protein VanJ